ncbi:BRISC complex subunit Abraxas 2-like [Anneissia japonica]|uniref:BRISC complex subunit Abraxas 2-like n=1 Tax=Anneissia japonica TaxID=1529436 RepID=UPI0014257385|nr:BRISC complex subunit Abraxas 2-like [Anneissia japonica]
MAKVKISGSIWGTLFFDHANSLGDQEGFLIGGITRHRTTDISDSQISSSKEELCINIQSFYPCEQTASFYDNKGHVDVVELLSVLKDNFKKVVGWYKFRRNTQPQISLRERAVHRSLVKALHNVSMNTFVIGMFTAQQTWNQSTHTFGYQLSYLNNKKFVPLPVEVTNLGDTSQSEYKRMNSQDRPSTLAVYDSILGKYTSVFADAKGKSIGLQHIQEMSTAMQTELQKISQNLLKSERDVSKLQSEVDELRKKAAEKIPKRPTEIINHDQKPVNNTANKQTAEIIPETIHRNVVNHLSPISPTGNFSLDELKSGNRQRSREISMDEAISEEMEVKDEKGDNEDPFAGLLSEMKNALQTSPGYMKGRQRLRTGSFETNRMNEGLKGGISNDLNSVRLRAFSDPPQRDTTQKPKSPSVRKQVDEDVLMEDESLLRSPTTQDSDAKSLSSDQYDAYCESASPTF